MNLFDFIALSFRRESGKQKAKVLDEIIHNNIQKAITFFKADQNEKSVVSRYSFR